MLIYDSDNRVVGELDETYFQSNDNTKSMRIALCVGHNPVGQGAVGSVGISEFEFNKEFLADLIPYLPPTHDYQIFTRKPFGNYNLEQTDLAKQIKEWGGCDLAIEFHFNASTNVSVNGHEILYLSDAGKTLAEKLDKKFDKYLDNNDRNIKRRNSGKGYGFLKRGTYPSLIVEPFFSGFQENFIEGGKLRQPLIAAYKEFFSEL
jgi:N-acetylmuramoyl-L-alanine amidase